MTPLHLLAVVAGTVVVTLLGSLLAGWVLDRLVSDDETDCSE